MVTVEEFKELKSHIREIVLRHERAAAAVHCTCSGLYQSGEGGITMHVCPGHEQLRKLEEAYRELSPAEPEQPKPEWIG